MSKPNISKDRRPIGDICNYYGGLFVLCHKGKYYWIIENYDTDFDNLEEWSEIDQELYIQLLKHEG